MAVIRASREADRPVTAENIIIDAAALITTTGYRALTRRPALIFIFLFGPRWRALITPPPPRHLFRRHRECMVQLFNRAIWPVSFCPADAVISRGHGYRLFHNGAASWIGGILRFFHRGARREFWKSRRRFSADAAGGNIDAPNERKRLFLRPI